MQKSESILKSLFTLAGPIVLTNLFHTAYQLVDTFWVGRLGAEAVAAVSLSFPIIFLLITLGGGFSLAGTILVAQNFGAKKLDQVNLISSQTISLMMLISIPLTIAGFTLAGPLMSLMGAEPAVLPQATSYLKVSSLGIIFMFTFFVFQSLMRGVGQVKKPLYIVASTVLLNLILDPLFIMGWGSFEGYGVTGAAVATIITQALSAMIGLYVLFKGSDTVKINLAGFKLQPALVKKMFFLGLPASIEQTMKSLGLTIMSFLVATFGTVVVAAYGIGIRLMSFVIIPAFGLSMATSTLVGQNIGAKNLKRAKQLGVKGMQVGGIALTILGVLFFIFAKQFAITFVPGEAEVIAEATILIKFLCLSFPFIGVGIVLNGIFQGAGNTRVTMLFSIISLWVIEFPLSYILSKHTSLETLGLWIAIPSANAIMLTVTMSYFLMGRWAKQSLVDETEKLEQQVLKETMIEEGM